LNKYPLVLYVISYYLSAMIKTKITIATAILATMLIAAPTVFSNSSVNTAFAKTTHNYCFVAHSISTSYGPCFVTLNECKVGQNAAIQEASGPEPIVKIDKECYRATSSDKTTNNYCYDSAPAPTTAKSCFGSKKECESVRDGARASTHWYRVGSECYKL
jgi:hypothetical protein